MVWKEERRRRRIRDIVTSNTKDLRKLKQTFFIKKMSVWNRTMLAKIGPKPDHYFHWNLTKIWPEMWQKLIYGLILPIQFVFIPAKISFDDCMFTDSLITLNCTTLWKLYCTRTSWCGLKPSESDFLVQNRTFLRPVCSKKSDFGLKSEKIGPCGNTGYGQLSPVTVIGWAVVTWALVAWAVVLPIICSFVASWIVVIG